MNSKNSLPSVPTVMLAATALAGCAKSTDTKLAETFLRDFSVRATRIIEAPRKDPSESVTPFERDRTVNDEIIDMPDLGVDRVRLDNNEVRRIRETCVCYSVAPGHDSGSSHSYYEYCTCEKVESFPGYSATQDPVRTDEYEISYALERVSEDFDGEEVTFERNGRKVTVSLDRQWGSCYILDSDGSPVGYPEEGSYGECVELARRTRRAIASTRDNLQKRGYIARYNRHR